MPGTLLGLLVGMVLWPAQAAGYRPFDSTDAAVAAKGEVEIELGPVGWRRQGPERLLFAPSLVLNGGFADRLEAVLEGRQSFLLGPDGGGPVYRLQDTALSLKAVLLEGSLQGKEGPSIAMEIGALLPTVNGDAGLGAQGALIASRRWAAMAIHLNGQAVWTRTHVPAVVGGLILEGPERWPVRPVAELLAESERGAPAARSALVGAIWRFRDGLSFDAALRRGRVGRDDVAEVRLGLTWALSEGAPR